MTRKTIVTLIIVLLAVLMISDFRTNQEKVFEDYFWQMETESIRNLNKLGYTQQAVQSSREDSLVIDGAALKSLELENLMGSVQLAGEDRQDVEINYKITVYADTITQAEEALSELEVLSQMEGDRLLLALNEYSSLQGSANQLRGIRVDYRIKAPKKLALNINNKYGALNVANFNSNVVLTNRNDDMQVFDITGDARLTSKYGTLTVGNIEGSTVIEADYNKSTIRGIGRELQLESSYSDVNLGNVRGRADIEAKYGKLTLKNLEQDVKLDARYTVVLGNGIRGSLQGNLRYGGFAIDDVLNDLNIKSEYADLEVKLDPQQDNYSFDCLVEDGDIETSLPLKVESEGRNQELKGKLGNGQIQIKLESRRGDIHLAN